MGKLYETFLQIDSGRQKCIDSLNAMKVSTPRDATFANIAEKIKECGGEIDIVKDQKMWERPEEWIDTKEILLNAPELVGFTPFAVYLLHDNKPNISLKIMGNSYNSDRVYDAYYLSDGNFLTNDTTSSVTVDHTWDDTKDIPTTLGYKLRYVIEYARDTKLTYVTSLKKSYFGLQSQYGIGASLLEIVFNSNVMPAAENELARPHMSSTLSIDNAIRIHILGENQTSFSGTYPSSLQELQIDKSGSLTFKHYFDSGSTSYFVNLKVVIPNATELLIYSTGSTTYLNASYIYAPNVTSIVNDGLSGYLYCLFLYAPKLTTMVGKHTVSRDTIKYIPNVRDFSNITASNTTYLNKRVYSTQMNDFAITGDSSGWFWYNETVTNITNTSQISSLNYNGVYFPSLKTVEIANVFRDNSNSQYTKSFIIGDGFKSNLNISHLTRLSTINLLDILNKLADVTNEETTRTLTLGESLLGKLSDEEKAIGTDKGWVLE